MYRTLVCCVILSFLYYSNAGLLGWKIRYNNFGEITRVRRNAIKNTFLFGLWPNATIPFIMSDSYSTVDRKIISFAMEEFHNHTCIRFVNRTNENFYLDISPRKRNLGMGCWSFIGRWILLAQPQPVSLGRGCVHKGIVMHELMHAIGFYHEHSRTDRDNFVDVNYDDMHDSIHGQFKKYNEKHVTDLGTKYDYHSIMHYLLYDGTKTGKPTLVPKGGQGVAIGKRLEFSEIDIEKINLLYKCDRNGMRLGECKNKRFWCYFVFAQHLCFGGWVQRICPKTCGFCP